MTLVKRIIVEKKPLLVPLALALFVNVAVYALVVYPLETKAASASDRAAAAAQSLSAAKGDLAAARGLVTGKSHADQELATFYNKVLPADFAAAQRMTYAWVPALARKTNVRYEARHQEIEAARESSGKSAHLGRLKTRVVLQGDYENIRQFVYDLETAPEFVIIDDVSIAQTEANRPLSLTLELSTYYRLGANGS
jgi:Type II secretion system (T2SS), protein M subtype b